MDVAGSGVTGVRIFMKDKLITNALGLIVVAGIVLWMVYNAIQIDRVIFG